MEDKKICPKCGTEFLSAVGNACPKCLAQFAMGQTDTGKSNSNQTQSGIENEPILSIGTKVGPYEIKAILGRGGMGTVYQAHQPMLDRFVALKILPGSFAQDADFVKRFNREAKALAGLSHPNIVSVYDMGQSGDHFYFAMEFIEGVTLRDLIAQGKLPPEEALKIVPQLCDALEYAHTEGVIHRDIKPENILIDKKGRIKIADFGLARIVRGDTSVDTVTRSQEVMGTYEYMAPEQRVKTKGVDHRADIYSLGVVFYEMLTGELPIGKFELPSHKVHIDIRLDNVVLKALEREPSRRYQRVSQIGDAVSKIMSEPSTQGWSRPEESQGLRYSTLSIFSLVLSFLPLMITQLLGIIFGIVSIRQINRSGGQLKGIGFAVAGLVISVLLLFMIPFFVLPIAIPSFLKGRQMAMTDQGEKQVPEVLQKLALAQEVYRRADMDGDNRNAYATSMFDICSAPGIGAIIGSDSQEIIQSDEPNRGNSAKPYKGYFYRITPWDMDISKNGTYSPYAFAIAAYPEKPESNLRTFVVDERGIIYAKKMGNLRYPDTWRSINTENDDKRLGIDPIRDGWEIVSRVTISDEIIKNAYRLVWDASGLKSVLSGPDEKLLAQIKSRKISVDIPGKRENYASLATALKLVLGDIPFKIDYQPSQLSREDMEHIVPPFHFRDVTVDTALKTLLFMLPEETEWVGKTLYEESGKRSVNTVLEIRSQRPIYWVNDGVVHIALSSSFLPPLQEMDERVINAQDRKNIIDNVLNQADDLISRGDPIRAERLLEFLYQRLGDWLMANGYDAKASELSQKIQRSRDETERQAREKEYQECFQKAKELMSQKQYDEAFGILNKASHLKGAPEALDLLKQCEAELQNQRRVQDVKFDERKALIADGIKLMGREMYKHAIDAFQKAISISKEYHLGFTKEGDEKFPWEWIDVCQKELELYAEVLAEAKGLMANQRYVDAKRVLNSIVISDENRTEVSGLIGQCEKALKEQQK